MLLAALVALQATPEGVAERDIRELTEMLRGTWNNTEAAYFAEELGEAVPPPLSVLIAEGADGTLTYRDGSSPAAYGARLRVALRMDGASASAARSATDACEIVVSREGDGFLLSHHGTACDALALRPLAVIAPDVLTDHAEVRLRRADPYARWVSRKKDEGTDEGEDAWTWTPDITVREGEHVQLPDDPAARRPVGLKLRHVRWPYGRNRDSLVLYVHEAKDEPAVSYAWTEPDAGRIAVNLQWVQASCTREEGYEP